MVTILRIKLEGVLTILYFQKRENAVSHLCKVMKRHGCELSLSKRVKIEQSYPFECITLRDWTEDDREIMIELVSRKYYDDEVLSGKK